MTAQRTHLDSTLNKIINNNKREIAEMERECLDKKHQLIRGTGALVKPSSCLCPQMEVNVYSADMFQYF